MTTPKNPAAADGVWQIVADRDLLPPGGDRAEEDSEKLHGSFHCEKFPSKRH